MSTALRRMTVDEFLAWDEGQEERWEFDGLKPVAMTEGTRAHSLIKTNLITALGTRLRGTGCRVYTSDLRIDVGGSVRYPDAFVSCAKIENSARKAETPVVVFEVLSRSTAQTDQFVKNAEYRATASISRYVMVSQDEVAATVFAREGEAWIGQLATGWGSVLAMPEIGIEVPIDEVFEGVFERA